MYTRSVCHTTILPSYSFLFFFFNDPPTTEIYTLSLHDALPISDRNDDLFDIYAQAGGGAGEHRPSTGQRASERPKIGRAHVELQSRFDLVCRLLLEKKKKHNKDIIILRHNYNKAVPAIAHKHSI